MQPLEQIVSQVTDLALDEAEEGVARRHDPQQLVGPQERFPGGRVAVAVP